MSSSSLLPLTPIQNRISQPRSLEELEGTPVGDRDVTPKLQLCLELRKKDVSTKKGSKKKTELVLEVVVMKLKNMPQPASDKFSKSQAQKTFVKIVMKPNDIIYSTELKLVKQGASQCNLDFIEVFAFPLDNVEDLKEKTLEILVCDKKMTRNAMIFGKAEIDCLDEVKLENSISRWFNLV